MSCFVRVSILAAIVRYFVADSGHSLCMYSALGPVDIVASRLVTGIASCAVSLGSSAIVEKLLEVLYVRVNFRTLQSCYIDIYQRAQLALIFNQADLRNENLWLALSKQHDRDLGH